MKLLKTIIAALILFLPASSNAFVTHTSAYDEADKAEPTHFILCLKDGEQVLFLLEHTPRVINGENSITVVDDDVTIEYPLANVHKYLMGSDADTGIENISFTKDVRAGEINNRVGSIMLSGFDAAVPVTVTDINGMNMLRTATDTEGCLIIATSQYLPGIYIVKVQNQTFKFIKR